MGASKIQDETEAIRWFEQGKTYEEMVELYRTKYNIETTPSMWGNFRRRRGLDRRIVRDDALIPWATKPEHRHQYPIMMLRKEARRRAGKPISTDDAHAVDVWIEGMRANDTVLHYEPATEQGWFYVPRRPGIDNDIIREPEKASGRKAAS